MNYPATAYFLDDARYFEIALAEVPTNVCRQILQENLKEPLVIKVNGYAYVDDTGICEVDDEGTPAEMVFQYVSDLDSEELPYGTCKQDSDCLGDCVRCNEEGLCVSTCVGTERCATDTLSGAKVCCPKDKRSGPYCCEVKNNGMCCNEYGQCCPWYKPLADKDGKCYACDNAAGVNVKGVQDNCNVCTNRGLVGDMCVLPCPAETPVRDSGYKCHACDEEKPFVSPKECYKCPNRVLGGQGSGYCSLPCGEGIYADKPLMESYGHCHSCDEDNGIRVYGVEENCSKACPNRTAYGSICSKTCPDDKPLPSYANGCISCEDPTPVHVFGSKVACDICPQRVIGGAWNDYCLLPCGQGAYKDLPLTASNGTCHACDEEGVINAEASACAICSNRESIGDACVLPCPSDKPFIGYDGNCYACDEPFAVYVYLTSASCAKCPNRVLQGFDNNYCSLPCDEGIYEGLELVGADGKCYACETTERVRMSNVPENCRACDNRHLETVGSTTYCVLNE